MTPARDEDPPLQILLVEDNPGDVRLTREAFQEADRSINLVVAANGVEAMSLLKRQGTHSDAARPNFILLDLNLPMMNGHEVLARIKRDDQLKLIPTVILTTSEAESDIADSYEHQANCYLIKPVQFEDFVTLVKSIHEFWLTRAKLPSQAA